MTSSIRYGTKFGSLISVIDKTKTPNHYLTCMNSFKTKPRETAIVDDRVIRGISIGNQIGNITYWIQKGEYAHEHPNKETGEPSYKIDSIQDLLYVL